MKYSCNRCEKKYPCVIETIGLPEPPYSCIYANDETDIDADWKPLNEDDKNMSDALNDIKDFEMNGSCADCSNCGCSCSDCNDASGFSNHDARQSHEAPLMSDNLRASIETANERLKCKDSPTKDPKSRYYDAGVNERKFSLKIKGDVKELNITFKA